MNPASHLAYRPALLSLALALTGKLPAAQHALLIAIEDYSNVAGVYSLPGCNADLQAVRESLQKSFDFPPENIRTLVDQAATKANILEAINNLATLARPDDAVVIYYSGHGTQVPDYPGEDETTDNLDEVLVTYDFDFNKANETWLRDDHLQASLAMIKTKRVLVILDSCHAGTGTRGSAVAKGVDFGFAASIGGGRQDTNPFDLKQGDQSGHILLSSCAANETAAMILSDGKRRSLFTMAMLNVLPAMKAKPFAEMESAIHKEMIRLDAKGEAQQRPQFQPMPAISLQNFLKPKPGGDQLAQHENLDVPVTPSDGLPSAFALEVKTEQPLFVPGEYLGITVQSAVDGFLRLYSIDPRGQVRIFYPNFFERVNRIQRNSAISIGGFDSSLPLRVPVEEGIGCLLAVVSKEPFESTDEVSRTSQQKPMEELGKVTSFHRLIPKSTTPEKHADLGSALTFYEVRLARKSSNEIIKRIEADGKILFNQSCLPFFPELAKRQQAERTKSAQISEIVRALQSPQLRNLRFLVGGNSSKAIELLQNELTSAGIPPERIQPAAKNTQEQDPPPAVEGDIIELRLSK